MSIKKVILRTKFWRGMGRSRTKPQLQSKQANTKAFLIYKKYNRDMILVYRNYSTEISSGRPFYPKSKVWVEVAADFR